MATQSNEATGWVGWVFFASVLMMLSGGFQIIEGLVAVLRQNFYVTTPQHLVVFDLTAWGWINLALGVITLLAGIELLRGATWARVIAIFLASLSLLANMAFLPAYPIWSIMVIVFDAVVIYAVAMHGNELRD